VNRNNNPTASEPVYQSKVHLGRVVAGIALCIAGVILLPTVTMTAAGVVLCFMGVFLIAMAFASRKYGAAPHTHPRKGTHQDGEVIR
jgi:uncharacterized membrane protein HdeD (DUF308 family)